MKCNFNRVYVTEIPSLHLIAFEITDGTPDRLAIKNSVQNAIKTLLIDMGFEKIKDFSYGFLHLNAIERLAISVSHTRNLGIVALTDKRYHKSIGIDLEFHQRQVRENSKKFWINQDDQLEDPLLNLWVKKEAAFKAISPINSDCKLLKDLIIHGSRFRNSTEPKVTGQVFNFQRKIFERDVLLSIAALAPEKQ